MNPYVCLARELGRLRQPRCPRASPRGTTRWWRTSAASAQAERLTCDDECPHVEARTLWAEALATFGARAGELTFLRSRAIGASRQSEERLRRPTACRRLPISCTVRVGRWIQRLRDDLSPSPVRRTNRRRPRSFDHDSSRDARQ